jgi:hypothetical protein
MLFPCMVTTPLVSDLGGGEVSEATPLPNHLYSVGCISLKDFTTALLYILKGENASLFIN